MQPSPGEPYDLITMGRIGVDLYPLQTGVPLSEVDTFGKFLGGSSSNVAVAAARLGRRTATVTRTGADPFGEYLHRRLREFGVDDRWVTPVPGLPTPVTFCEVFPPDDFPLYFYRKPKAPDLEIHTAELDLDAIRAARVFWMTGTGLSEEPSRSATLAALAHRAKAGITVFDLDWRPVLWGIRPGRTRARPVPSTPRPCATRPSPSATSTRSRSPPASANRPRRRGRCSPPGCASPSSNRAPREYSPWPPTAVVPRCRRCPSTS